MKRLSLLLAGVAALLPSQLSPLMAEPNPATVAPAFDPPATPLVLTRTLWRSLRDGQEIMVRRSYEVRFVRNAEGFRLDGQLIDTAVDAPPALALLAEIERTRPDQGMFPMQLDTRGQIVAPPGRVSAGVSHRAALDQARTILASAAMDGEARRQGEQLARTVLESAVGAASWPSDLFSPQARSRFETRSLTLDGGQQAEIEVSVDVQLPGDGALPGTVERRVATRIEGSSRLSREVWTLTPARTGI